MKKQIFGSRGFLLKSARVFTLLSALAFIPLVSGCEDEKKCDSKCPQCGRKCDFPKDWNQHTHNLFDETFGKGTKLHKCGEQPGDHAWDNNGRVVGQFYRR